MYNVTLWSGCVIIVAVEKQKCRCQQCNKCCQRSATVCSLRSSGAAEVTVNSVFAAQ
jgi:hypothetical protein